jgi:hypothetical protein
MFTSQLIQYFQNIIDVPLFMGAYLCGADHRSPLGHGRVNGRQRKRAMFPGVDALFPSHFRRLSYYTPA